ncbi:hypothetical protein GCM10023258_13650 [Terrabacter aeriphilus]|uniref:YihY/virulence factor BrkB family protein n=1 Tax=Terrabacter aeriphilus TaxID=515662 RepID=A0ABP9J8Z3_9MICO
MGALQRLVQRLLDRLKQTEAWEAWQRYGSANGDLLAAGVGYFAFFSIFPALALAFAIFGFVLQGRPDLLTAIADSLNAALPGMVRTASTPDGIIGLEAPASLTLTITGIVSFVTLLLAGLGWIGALRTGIRGVFSLDASSGSLIGTKVRDLGVLVTLGVAIAASAILTSAAGGFAERVADWIGLPQAGVFVGLVGVVVGVLFDTLILVVMLRVLTDVPLPMRHVRQGAVLGAVILTVLKLFGGFLISRTTANPLLGAVAVAVGLLFWLNLMSKVVLLSAAWAANDVDVAALAGDGEPTGPPRGLRPAFVAPLPAHADASALPYAGAAPRAPAVADRSGEVPPAARATDRASLAAGAVLGAAAATAAVTARRLRRR